MELDIVKMELCVELNFHNIKFQNSGIYFAKYFKNNVILLNIWKIKWYFAIFPSYGRCSYMIGQECVDLL